MRTKSEHEGLDKRLDLMVSAEWLGRLDDWRFGNRIESRAEAIRRLVSMALIKGAAATGEGFADTTPAAVSETGAFQGANSINQAG